MPFLAAVGRPCAVNPPAELRAAADERGWPIERWARPRSGVEELLRTSASVAGLALAGGVGIFTGRRQAARSAGADLALALAGVDVRDAGREHLVTGPCVAVYNHRSPLDTLVMTRLTAGRAHIAGGDDEAALLRRLRERRPVAVAPEGEPSITRNVGPFGERAFHVARRAGVPVVPVAIHDAGELMWRGARLTRRGTVRVTVLPPVATVDWRAGDIADHAETVRRAIQAQLTGPATST
jgi:putative phosphoserine phosphatase/1-acylglycerol-3-phosphate O-acyltransferase